MNLYKKSMIAAALLLLITVNVSNAQWNGTGTSGTIYRSGYTLVGSNCTSSFTALGGFEVNQTIDDFWSAYLYNGGGGGQGMRIKGASPSSGTPLFQVEANNWYGGSDDIGNIRFQIQANGIIGIGTTYPYGNPKGYTLAVNGIIGAK